MHWARGTMIAVVVGACCLGVAATVGGATHFGSSKAKHADRPRVAPVATTTTTRPARRVPVRTVAEPIVPALTPENSVNASVFPSDGLAVGVGQPIVFRFDHFVSSDSARAAVLSHLDVTESQPVLGGWHWFNDSELHFRPRSYWPAKERVTVAWDLRGWDAGNGMWGAGRGVVHWARSRNERKERET